MTGIFKQKNTTNNLLLLIYGLALKFNIFLHPVAPQQSPQDHFLYTWLMNFLKPVGLPPVIYVLAAFLLLYSQAMLFNRVCNDQKLLAKPNYLAGMAFLLVTSLFKEWNYFSAPLLTNSFLIWIYYRLIILHNSNKPGAAIFNIGLIMGITTLVYQPSLVFVLLIWAALFIMRPFRIQEWLINLLGITTPYYFLAILLYLANQWDWKKLAPNFTFGLPSMPSSFLVTISIILLVLPFIIGGFFVQANLSKMFIQVRKSWSLLLIYLIISLVLIMVEGGTEYVNWMLCAVPLTAFHAAAYYYPSGKTFPAVMHWILFAYAIYILYVVTPQS